MDLIEKLINHIPEILLYIIPGFISVRMKEIYGLQKRHNELGYALYSILYSFIILLIYRIITVTAGAVWPSLGAFLEKETVKSCGCLALAVALGILLAKIPQLKPGRWFSKLVNKLSSPEETVWEKAMKNPNGAYARVYLNNGMVYYGTTAYYGYPLLEAFSKHHPDVRVSTITAQTTQIYKHLHKGTIDVGLTITSSDYGDEVERATVATIPLYAFMQTDHPLANRTSISLEDLAKQKLVLNSIPVDRPHHILQLFERHGIIPTDNRSNITSSLRSKPTISPSMWRSSTLKTIRIRTSPASSNAFPKSGNRACNIR